MLINWFLNLFFKSDFLFLRHWPWRKKPKNSIPFLIPTRKCWFWPDSRYFPTPQLFWFHSAFWHSKPIPKLFRSTGRSGFPAQVRFRFGFRFFLPFMLRFPIPCFPIRDSNLVLWVPDSYFSLKRFNFSEGQFGRPFPAPSASLGVLAQKAVAPGVRFSGCVSGRRSRRVEGADATDRRRWRCGEKSLAKFARDSLGPTRDSPAGPG